MANPTVTARLNKTVFAPGETITLIVDYADTDSASFAVTVVATDAAGNTSEATVSGSVADAVTLSVSDSAGRTWTKTVDNGSSEAVFTAIA